MDINSRQIDCFLTSAKYLNFTQAANTLYLSKSAVSRQIKNLEEELGTALFIRSNNELSLTEAGEIMYKSFVSMQNAFESDLRHAKDMLSKKTMKLAVSFAGEIMFDFLWEKYFHRFELENPAISVSYTYRNPYLTDYNHLNADLLFIHDFSLGSVANKQKMKVFSTRRVVWVAADHPIARKGRLDGEDIRRYPVVTLYDRKKHIEIHKEIFDYYRARPERIIEIPSSFQMVIHLLQDQAMAVGDEYTYKLDDRFVQIPYAEEVSKVDFYVCWDENSNNPVLPLVLKDFKTLVF